MERPTLKSARELEFMREAGQVVAAIHEALVYATEPGVSTEALDNVVANVIAEADAKANFLNYHGFPANVCISINEEVVHGIPGTRTLAMGDIVSYDCGAYVVREGKNWHADAAVTVIVGQEHLPDAQFANLTLEDVLSSGDTASLDETVKERRALSYITRKAMWAGLGAVNGARRINDIGAAIEDQVELLGRGLGSHLGWKPEIIEGYTGHGIGTHLHEDPSVYNYRTRGRSPKVVPGMALCVEPMVIAGDSSSTVLEDEWTVVTLGGNDAAHWEHTVAVGRNGISVLTARDGGAAGLAPYEIIPVSDFTE